MEGGGGRGYEDAAPKDMAFLPLCKHVDSDLQRKRNAFTHPRKLSLSLSFSPVDTIACVQKKKKKRSGPAPSLSGRRP